MTLVMFTPEEIAIIDEETRVRDAAIDATGLGMDTTSGSSTRLERQRVGVMGEAAMIKALARDVREVLSGGKLDGGTDVIVKAKSGVRTLEYRMSIKSSMTPTPQWVYANDKGRFRVDMIALVAKPKMPDAMDIIGWQWMEHFKRYAEVQQIGGRPYLALKSRELLPVEWLLRMSGLPT